MRELIFEVVAQNRILHAHKKGKNPINRGNSHLLLDTLPLTRGQAFFKFSYNWENSHKNVKIPLKRGTSHLLLDTLPLSKLFLQILIKMGKFP
jgi:hypothetical protein